MLLIYFFYFFPALTASQVLPFSCCNRSSFMAFSWLAHNGEAALRGGGGH